MNQVTLYRIDPNQNMARFYALYLAQDLFGDWCLVREWGRVGTLGQMHVEPYPSFSVAETELRQVQSRKQRRGYAAC